MTTEFKDPDLGVVTMFRRRGLRRMSLSVRANGGVRLSMPASYSWKEGLRFLESKREWVIASQRQMREKYGEVKPLDAAAEKALRAKAKETLPQMVAELAAQCGFSYGRVSVRRNRTRWGSCSARNDISLNIHLVELTEELQRFVVLHELCHTRIKNHSVQFHALLNGLTDGRERELNRQLRSQSSSILL